MGNKHTEIVCSYFYRVLRPGQYSRHFEELRETGVDAIAINFDEEESFYWHEKEIKRACGIAHDMGLKIYAGYCRFGGVFAGDRWVPSSFVCRNPATHVVDHAGASRGLCCVNNAEFRRWYFETTEKMLESFDVDGVLLDEPKGIGCVCYCPTCRQMASSDDELPGLRTRSIVSFLADCCASSKRVNPKLKTMLVVETRHRDLIRAVAAIDSLDVLGTDPYWMHFDKDLDWLSDEAAFLVKLAREHGKQSQLWAQNFGVPEGRESEIGDGFDLLARFEPDQICTFYDIIWNDDPDAVWEIAKEAIRRIKGEWPRTVADPQ